MKIKLMLFLVALVGGSIGARVLLEEGAPAPEKQARAAAKAGEEAPAQPASEARGPGLSKLGPSAQREAKDKAARLRAVVANPGGLNRPITDAAKGLTKVKPPKTPPKDAKEAAERLAAKEEVAKEGEGEGSKKGEAPPAPPWPKDTKGIVKRILPYVTESGIAGLFGVALGVTTKSFARIILAFVALCFIVIQFLAYKEILTVDWGKFVLWAQSFVFNLSDKEMGMGAILQHKLPAAGALGVGYLLGLKKG